MQQRMTHFRVLFIFLQFLTVIRLCHSSLKCKKLHRADRTDLVGGLVCGECLEFYVEDWYQTCIPIDFVLKPPFSIFVVEPEVIRIPCKFSSGVNCAWFHNRTLITEFESDGYRPPWVLMYPSYYTLDCSITVNSATFSAGTLTCGVMSNEGGQGPERLTSTTSLTRISRDWSVEEKLHKLFRNWELSLNSGGLTWTSQLLFLAINKAAGFKAIDLDAYQRLSQTQDAHISSALSYVSMTFYVLAIVAIVVLTIVVFVKQSRNRP